MLKHCPNIQGYHYCDCKDDCQIRKELIMAQQTAVEWLLENIQKVHKMDWDIVFVQAMMMEKEQIRMAFTDGKHDGKFKHLESEQYFKETYKI
jgi:hypothetical protein